MKRVKALVFNCIRAILMYISQLVIASSLYYKMRKGFLLDIKLIKNIVFSQMNNKCKTI
jgi:hypothetical protein